MQKKIQTTQTYNKSAKELAIKFDKIGARREDIEEVFLLNKKINPIVLEIGCGNGRDAEVIVKHTEHYLGLDISEELIKLAKEKVPQAHFEIADIVDFIFPQNIDIVFAFASLIHVNKEEFGLVLSKINKVLNIGGIIRISLKHSEEYREVTKEDEFGVRTYYFYSEKDIQDLAKNFKVIKSEILQGRDVKWLEVIIKKE